MSFGPGKLRPYSTLFSLSEYQLVDEQEESHVGEGLAALTLVDREERTKKPGPSSATGTGCSTCGVLSFDDVDEQRQHFRCDWHRYNVKMRVLDKAVVDELEFDEMVAEDDIASISGSEDEYEYDTDGGFVGGDRTGDGDDNKDEADALQRHASLAPYCIFRVCVGDSQDAQLIAFWKCLSVPDAVSKQTATTKDAYLSLKGEMQRSQQWAVVMLQGGHFAAAVYDVVCPSAKVLAADKTQDEMVELCLKEVRHKSFHRYVVRAKAGGKQSDKDATGKYAKSAGSRLRRHNEAVLKQEIVETLTEWKSALDECSMIFLSCPGSNRLVLFDKDSPLDKTDPKLRRIPFVVRRPTISETKRVIKTMLTVYVLDRTGIPDNAEVQRKKEAKAAKESAQAEKVRIAEEQRQAAKAELQRQEEINKAKNKEKKQRQKERRKLMSQQGSLMDAAEAPMEVDLDAELKLLAAAVGSKANKDKKQPATQVKPKARALKPEDAATRREKLAEAAERRAAALAAASSTQKLH